MRKLATNELRLLALFSAAVFLALNLFGASAWMKHRAGVAAKITATKNEIAEGKTWIEGAGALAPAHEWIEANPPPENTPQQASTGLLELARSAAEENGLKIIEENLLPAAEVTTGSAAALEVKVSGPFAGVARFLFALQTPTAWRAVDRMMVRSDTEPPNVLVELKVRQYYRNQAAVPPAPGP
jgi:hypothetical protein